jgi:hypothetical protein
MPQLKPTRGIRLNRSHPFSRGLVGFWLMNEGSGNKVFDLSGNGNAGTFQGTAPSWSSGKFGPAVSLPGTDEYIEIPDADVFTPALTPFSVSALVNMRDATNFRIAGKGIIFTNGEWAFGTTSADRLQFMVHDESVINGYRSREHDTPLTNYENQWIHLFATYDGGTSSDGIKMYLNGVRIDDTDNTGVGTFISVENLGGPVYIGCHSTLYANGLFDNVMIWRKEVSASEVALLHREPFCMFGRVNRPELIGGQIVNLAGSSVALSSLSATVKVMRKVGGNVVGTSDVAALLNSIRSLLEVERDWLREALFNGMTANAFKLGTTLSLGWFWVRVAGCSVLYRGFSMGEIDFVNILAVDEKNALEISPSSYISHNGSSTYFYVVRRFNNCGYQERTLAASVKVSIESNGELAEPQPNKVFDSGAKLVDGNKIQLVWYYCLLEQKSQPMCFNVYYDGRTGQIDYENPLVIISYKGRKFYSYQSGALEAGRYLFAIRTEDASGKENSSLARLRIQFNTTNPDAIDILSVEGV